MVTGSSDGTLLSSLRLKANVAHHIRNKFNVISFVQFYKLYSLKEIDRSFFQKWFVNML